MLPKYYLVFIRKVLTLHRENGKQSRNLKQGALAHLARALDWQSKGDEFESRMLHWATMNFK